MIFLFSTVGANGSIHFCGGELTEISFLTKAECSHEKERMKDDCGMKCCKSEKKQKEEEGDCCDTEDLIDVQDFNSVASFNIAFIQTILLPDFCRFLLIEENSENGINYAYFPPPDDREILVEIQCFRI